MNEIYIFLHHEMNVIFITENRFFFITYAILERYRFVCIMTSHMNTHDIIFIMTLHNVSIFQTETTGVGVEVKPNVPMKWSLHCIIVIFL